MKESNMHRVGAGRRAGLCSTTASHFADEKMEAQRQEVTAQGHRLMTEPRFDFRSVWL